MAKREDVGGLSSICVQTLLQSGEKGNQTDAEPIMMNVVKNFKRGLLSRMVDDEALVELI